MTNAEIILNAAVDAGLYTEEEAVATVDTFGSLPLHTFAEWKKMGYIVKKGEKATIAISIWRKSNKNITVITKEGVEKDIKDDRYYKKLSYFFTFSQVEKMTA